MDKPPRGHPRPPATRWYEVACDDVDDREGASPSPMKRRLGREVPRLGDRSSPPEPSPKPPASSSGDSADQNHRAPEVRETDMSRTNTGIPSSRSRRRCPVDRGHGREAA